MITFTDKSGPLGTVELASGRLAGSTPLLQLMANRALARENGNTAAAYARLLRSGNAYVQATESGGANLAVELASGMAWLHELRDAHGEWTRTPGDKPGTGLDRYKVPPHERLISHAPNVNYPDPADYPFFKKHPVSVQNIIDAYDATPKAVREDGMTWYHTAHLLAKAMAHGNAEEGAILLGNYSSSADWPINMFRAARVADEGKPIPKGQGYISGDQVKKAQKALDGQHIDQVLISPKTRSFAHLLAQGDDSPDDPYGHVVIDAHALNVAAGGTIRGATYKRGKKQRELALEDTPPIATDVRAHEYVGDLYREAASIVSHRDGVLIKPHQMQAIPWVAQVLANQAADRAVMEGGATGGVLGRAKGRLANEVKDWKTWLAYATAHHLPMVPGVSALAAQALLAQVIEMAGEDSMFAQLDLAAWEHELRDPHTGRWMKAGGLAPSLVEAERAAPASEGDVRLALIKSQVYTAQQFDKMQAEIHHLQDELDKEGKDEAKAVLAAHLAWIGAGIAVALILTGIGAPAAVAVLAGLLPALGSEFSELAVVLGKGQRFLAHPVTGFKVALHHQPQAALAADPLHDQAAAVVAQWLARTGYAGSQASQLADALVSQWMADNPGRVAAARKRDMSGSMAAQVIGLAFNPAEPRGPDGRWDKGGSIVRQALGTGTIGHDASLTADAHVVSAEAFSQRFGEAFKGSPYAAFVNHYTPDEIRAGHMIPVLAAGGKAGMLIHPHGDGRIEPTGLFNTSGRKGMGLALLRMAIDQHGANYVEAYGPALPKMYATLGFADTDVFPFDPAQASPDWNTEKFDHPDYHLMALPGTVAAANEDDSMDLDEIRAAAADDPSFSEDAWNAALAVFGVNSPDDDTQA